MILEICPGLWKALQMNCRQWQEVFLFFRSTQCAGTIFKPNLNVIEQPIEFLEHSTADARLYSQDCTTGFFFFILKKGSQLACKDTAVDGEFTF